MTATADDPVFDSALEQALDELVARQRHLLGDLPLTELVHATRDFVRGGKRLRARFCHAGWLIAGGDRADDRIARAAAAFEWLQGSAIVHDDLMDGSDTRRGRPSMHRAFEALHREQGRTGDAATFGAQVAVLVGDLMLSWADEALHASGTQSTDWRLDLATPLWDAAKTEVVAGQYLDVVAQTRHQLSVDEAMTVVRFKAAKYTIERPLQVGAALAGASPALLDGLSQVAIPLGEAFQLRDDLLGVFGDPQTTGKPAGDDLREGKRTVLIARTVQLLPEGDHHTLWQHLGDADKVAPLTDLIERSGARAAVEADITELADSARSAAANLGPVAEQIMTPLIDAATSRDH